MAELMAAGLGCGICFGVVGTGLFILGSVLSQPTASGSARDRYRWRQQVLGKKKKRR